MIIKTYGEPGINPKKAKTGWISEVDEHTKRHSSLRSCVDGFIYYKINGTSGILMAYRDAVPPHSSDIWVPGGEWKRGIMNPLESLALKMKEETNLTISNPSYLGLASILWKDGPFDSQELKNERKKRSLGSGIHDVAHAFFANARGNLKLKSMSSPIVLVNSENYEKIMREYKPHSYIRFFVKEALKRIK